MENLRQALRSIAHSAANCDDQARYKTPADCVAHLLYIARRALDNHAANEVRHDDGGIYDYIGCAFGAGESKNEAPKEIYMGKDGRLWFRSTKNFNDRFNKLKT